MSSSSCLHRGHRFDRSVPSPRQAAASTATGTSEKSSSGKGGGGESEGVKGGVSVFSSSFPTPSALIIWRTTASSSFVSLVSFVLFDSKESPGSRGSPLPPKRSASTSARSVSTSRLRDDISPRSISRQSSCALRARTTAAASWYLSASPELARLTTAPRGRRRAAGAEGDPGAAARPRDTAPGARDVDVESAFLDTTPREAGLLGARVAPPPDANARGVADVKSDFASMLRVSA
mmetsp:Transcript_1254/g.5070  ORF Transcript_1254/g.5070 Transcript_1254/m.5070 type:complete len:235 (+) Transcript_1254:919-1623(+)